MRTIDQPNLPWILYSAVALWSSQRYAYALTTEQAIAMAFAMWDEVQNQAEKRQELGGDK